MELLVCVDERGKRERERAEIGTGTFSQKTAGDPKNNIWSLYNFSIFSSSSLSSEPTRFLRRILQIIFSLRVCAEINWLGLVSKPYPRVMLEDMLSPKQCAFVSLILEKLTSCELKRNDRSSLSIRFRFYYSIPNT